MSDKFPVVEMFGPTMQGEGALAGRLTYFIRFGGCDYACSWCDSSAAVLPEKVRLAPKMTEDEILDRMDGMGGSASWVTISGGNPLLHKLGGLVKRLRLRGWKVAVETQGTRFADWLYDIDLVTVSPKGPSSGNVTPVLSLGDFTGRLHGRLDRTMALKVVVFNDEDYEYAVSVHSTFARVPFYLSVGTYMGGLHGDYGRDYPVEGTSLVTPIDDTASILSRWRELVARTSSDNRFGDVAVFAQLHALLWGHELGH